MRKNIIDI